MLKNINPTELESWKELEAHFQSMKEVHMRDMFLNDASRFDRFSIFNEELLFDYSKNRIDDKTLTLLVRLAEEIGLSQGISSMFSGEKINQTEQRPVLHTALRNFSEREIYVDGFPVMSDVKVELEKVKLFSEKVISGKFKGFTGKKIDRIVNIGIGGSDLGPKMVCEALRPYQVGPEVNYVSNIDGMHLSQVLKSCSAETTLFIIVSKTFTTQETMTNANSAKKWLLNALGSEKAVRHHFVAVSTNSEAVVDFGINSENQFIFWDWVGGRYSLWSAVGLSIAIHLGYENFEKLLQGAHSADEHFRTTELNKNIPVIMGLLGVWYTNFFQSHSHAVMPYNQCLNMFPSYLQQGDMESNGKSVDRNGNKVNYETGPIIWGKPGTDGQHSFFQLIHQGTKLIPCDFISVIHSQSDLQEHQDILFSNFIAQSEALMTGKTSREVKTEDFKQDASSTSLEPYKVFEGNKPCNAIVLDRLSPYNLGKLVAFYEHKIFVQGCIWNIFSFDQWGVELGKAFAKKILNEITVKEGHLEHDSSTNFLIQHYINSKKVN